MDSSGFLSPKANAFSIAHLIDRAQLADLAFFQQNPSYHWNSQVLMREMEGRSVRLTRARDLLACNPGVIALSPYHSPSINEFHHLAFAFPCGCTLHHRLWFVISFSQNASWTQERVKERLWGEQTTRWCLMIRMTPVTMFTLRIQVPQRPNLLARKPM